VVEGIATRFVTGPRTIVRAVRVIAVRVIAVRVSRTTANDAVEGEGGEDAAIVSTRYADAIAVSVDSFGPVPPTIDNSPNPTARARQNRRILFASTESRRS